MSCCQHALWGFKHPSTTIKLNINKGIRTSDDNTTLRLHCAHRGGALVCKHHVSGAAAAARKMHRTETVLHFYCHSCKVFRHKHASSDFKQPSDSLPSTNPICSTASRPNTKLSARLTASSSKGTCCSDIALNPCLCHPSYVFRHCYSSGSFRHPSNRCASSKLSCSAFSRPMWSSRHFPIPASAASKVMSSLKQVHSAAWECVLIQSAHGSWLYILHLQLIPLPEAMQVSLVAASLHRRAVRAFAQCLQCHQMTMR